MTADDLADYLSGRGIDVRRHGREYRVACPAHEDPTPSCDFRDGERGVVITCRAGCEREAIVAAWGLTMADLFHEQRNGNEPEAIYRYEDERGRLLYEVVRFPGKQFRQRRPDGNGGWTWNLDGVRRVPYRLPQIVAAVAQRKVICICEGEKDVHALERAGRIATCNPGGAGKWRDQYAEHFRGAGIVVIADRDEPGYAHAEAIAGSLSAAAASLTVVEPAYGKDASEHLSRLSFGDFVPLGLAEQNGRKAHPRFRDMRRAVAHAGDSLPLRCGMLAIDGMITTVAGSRAERKSWLMLALCDAVARGVEVAGIRCAKGNALYIDAENGEREMARRFVNAGIDPDAFEVAEGLGVHLPNDTSVIGDMIVAANANLCILDSLRRLAPHAREDKSDDMAPLYSELATVVRETHCALIVLHHRSVKFGAPDTRGSSAIEDQTDLLYVLEGVRGDSQRAFRKRLRCPKNRVEREPPPRWMRFDRIGGFMSVVEAEPYEPEEEEDEPAPIADQLAQTIRELAPEVRKDGGWAPWRLAEAVGRQRDDWAFRQALGDLLASGEWVAEGKTRARVVRPADMGGEDFPYGERADRPYEPEGSEMSDFPGVSGSPDMGGDMGDAGSPPSQPPISGDDDEPDSNMGGSEDSLGGPPNRPSDDEDANDG